MRKFIPLYFFLISMFLLKTIKAEDTAYAYAFFLSFIIWFLQKIIEKLYEKIYLRYFTSKSTDIVAGDMLSSSTKYEFQEDIICEVIDENNQKVSYTKAAKIN